MAPKRRDTHQAEYHKSRILRQSYLSYISSILQNRGISDKIVKFVKKRYKYYWYGQENYADQEG